MVASVAVLLHAQEDTLEATRARVFATRGAPRTTLTRVERHTDLVTPKRPREG